MTRGKPPKGPSKPSGYDVGYGKPPSSRQFKPGKSGNPKGRPKGSQNVVTDIRDVFFSTVTMTLPNGKPQKVPVWKAGLWKLAAKVMQGDLRAYSAMMQLLESYGVLPIELLSDVGDLTQEDADALEDVFARMAEGRGIDLKALIAASQNVSADRVSTSNVRKVDFSLMDKAAYEASIVASRERRSSRD